MNGSLPAASLGPRRTRRAAWRRAALIAVIAVAIAACGGSAALSTAGQSGADGSGGASSDAAGPAGAPIAAATAAPAPASEAYGAAKGGDQAAVDLANGTGPLIVRTGQLDLQVDDLQAALASAAKVVAGAGGYVAASQRAGDAERATAWVTYRVPVARWDATLADLRAVGAKVLSEQTSSEEVTSQVVDLGARLTNLRVTEAALQGIMAKATKIPDVLDVQAQLTAVRQQIEELTAQKQALEERAAMATLTVSFALPPVVAVTAVREGWDPAKEIDRAAATLVGLGQGLASAGIWVAIVILPLAVILGIVAGVAWVVARRLRGHPAPPAPPSSPLGADAPAA